MAVAQYRDEVLVTLTSFDAPPTFSFPNRRFFLTKEKPVMDIGRTSKRNSSFEAAKNNAWFDSPVMSRDHAQFKLDVDKQKVYIKDIGSLHGTFKNELLLARNARSPVETGDIIRFGIPIERGSDRYPPCTMEAHFKFGTTSPEDRPKVFRVPDDSDVEDSSSDDDHSIRHSSDILRNTKIRPAVFPSSSPSQSPIDLTVNDQYPISNVRGDNDYNTNALPPVPTAAKPALQVTYVDLSSPPPEQVTEYNGFSPISPEAVWMLEAEAEDCDLNLSDSTDMDTESSRGDSPSQSPILSPRPTDIPMECVNQDDLDLEEDDFREQDEFEAEDFASDQVENSTDRGNDESLEQLSPIEICVGVEEDDSSLANNIHEESEASIAGVSTSENAGQDNAEYENNCLMAIRGILSTQLPPIEEPKMALSPWAQPCCVQPPRLPSISEAMPPYPSTQSAYKAAELMGAKTGKIEYFIARAENKNYAFPSGVVTCGSSVPTTQVESSDRMADSNNLPQQPREADSSAPEQSTSSATEALPAQVTAPSSRLAPSQWTASGVQFLNSPPEETQKSPQSETSVLDETSAYQYELSKKAANGPTTEVEAIEAQPPAAKRTHMEISDILEASNETRDQEAPRPLKRKAEAISEPALEECADEKVTSVMRKKARSVAAQKRFRLRKKYVPVTNMGASTTSDSTISPPAKRLRRFAEVVGFAALGGVAVMSALIATAPTL